MPPVGESHRFWTTPRLYYCGQHKFDAHRERERAFVGGGHQDGGQRTGRGGGRKDRQVAHAQWRKTAAVAAQGQQHFRKPPELEEKAEKERQQCVCGGGKRASPAL